MPARIDALLGKLRIKDTGSESGGTGLPAGGLTGYHLVKRSGTDYDAEWVADTDILISPSGKKFLLGVADSGRLTTIEVEVVAQTQRYASLLGPIPNIRLP